MSIAEIKNILKLIPCNQGEIMYTSSDSIPKSEQKKIVNHLDKIESILNSVNQKPKQ